MRPIGRGVVRSAAAVRPVGSVGASEHLGNGMRRTQTKEADRQPLYVMPALLFVLAFTAVSVRPHVLDLAQRLVAHHAARVRRPRQLLEALDDDQFWASLRFTLKYTLLITPILMIGGYLVALLTAGNTRLRRFTRTVRVHAGRHRPRAHRACCGTGCSAPGTGSSTGSCTISASSTSRSCGSAPTPASATGR